MKFDITHALRELYPEGAKFIQEGIEYSGLKWVDERPKPTKKELNDKVAELQTEYDAKKYQRDRATSYPSIQEQLDMQYWDAVNGTKKWKEAVAKVKTDNPKPSE
tara:strand:- start:768 stop:1082 length:315 start_codon:yes stop_codon:yes gene_type:complete